MQQRLNNKEYWHLLKRTGVHKHYHLLLFYFSCPSIWKTRIDLWKMVQVGARRRYVRRWLCSKGVRTVSVLNITRTRGFEYNRGVTYFVKYVFLSAFSMENIVSCTLELLYFYFLVIVFLFICEERFFVNIVFPLEFNV